MVVKGYTFSLLLFVFGLIIVSVSIWRSRQPLVSLALEESFSQQEMVVDVSDGTASGQVSEDDYSLPYPGMLPDHPLYFLKMVRDRVQLWMTRDALKRAELLLLYADKRIAAALALAEKGKSGLAVSTATKAGKYLERAVNTDLTSVDEVKQNELSSKIRKASVKHSKVLDGVSSRVPDELKTSLESVEETVKQVQERVGGVMEGNGDEMEMEEEDKDEQVGEVEESETEAVELE